MIYGSLTQNTHFDPTFALISSPGSNKKSGLCVYSPLKITGSLDKISPSVNYPSTVKMMNSCKIVLTDQVQNLAPLDPFATSKPQAKKLTHLEQTQEIAKWDAIKEGWKCCQSLVPYPQGLK